MQRQDQSIKSITFLVPFYNEEAAIPFLFKRLLPVLTDLSFSYEMQLVLVDDGSADGTHRELLRTFTGLTAAKTVILRHAVNRGIGGALKTGLEAATGDLICTLDSDCTYAPEEMPQMIDMLLRTGVDIVTGSPYHPDGSVSNVPPNRLLLSKTASRMYSLIVPTKLYCYTSFFRVYRREWARTDFFLSPGFLAVTEILLSAANRGARIAEFPISLGARSTGRSKMRVAKVTLDHLKLMSKTAVFNAVMGGASTRMVKDRPSIPSAASARRSDQLLDQWALVGHADCNPNHTQRPVKA